MWIMTFFVIFLLVDCVVLQWNQCGYDCKKFKFVYAGPETSLIRAAHRDMKAKGL